MIMGYAFALKPGSLGSDPISLGLSTQILITLRILKLCPIEVEHLVLGHLGTIEFHFYYFFYLMYPTLPGLKLCNPFQVPSAAS